MNFSRQNALIGYYAVNFAAKQKPNAMKYIFTLVTIILWGTISAQYTTPDAGLTIDLEYLALNSDGAVMSIGDSYLFVDDVIIAPTDVFEETASVLVMIQQNVLITVQGGFILNVEGILFTWATEGEHYEGFRFEEGSHVQLANAVFQNGGGLRVLTEDFQMTDCAVINQEMIASTGGAVGLSSGKPVFTNCVFLNNVTAAINSSANIAVAPVIEDCVFQNNGTSVVNKPQINLGPSGADTTFIRNNIVEGSPENVESGGVAISSVFGVETHAVIEQNVVYGNRYGIAVIGNNVTSLISNNLIYDNNIQNDPMLGGSGININSGGDNHAVITANVITGNLWGMTLQGTASANLGDMTEESPGLNIFENNGNEGEIYALFNNTPNDIMAMNNCWDGTNNITEAEAEAVISHQPDDESLGLVTYLPLGFCSTVSTGGLAEKIDIHVFPNPVREQLKVQSESRITNITILDVAGRVVLDQQIFDLENIFEIPVTDLPAGVYLLQLNTADGIRTKRFVKE